MGPIEGVGSGRVDNAELAEAFDRCRDPFAHGTDGLAGELLAPCDVVDLRGRGRHTFGEDPLTEEGVDKR